MTHNYAKQYNTDKLSITPNDNKIRNVLQAMCEISQSNTMPETIRQCITLPDTTRQCITLSKIASHCTTMTEKLKRFLHTLPEINFKRFQLSRMTRVIMTKGNPQ